MKRSRITEVEALQLIKKKYPNAIFWYERNENKSITNYNITFNGHNSKVYTYSCINTLHFLKKIHVIDNNMMYEKDYENIKKSILEDFKKYNNLKKSINAFDLFIKNDIKNDIKFKLKRIKNVIVLDI